MKFFMHDISLIDKSVYKTGCFRMLYSSKFGKKNKLIFHKSYNYDDSNKKNIFLDSCICNTDKLPNVAFDIPTIDRVKNTSRIKNNTIYRNYKYLNVDLHKIKDSLNKITIHSDDYLKWLIVGFSLKDLYLSVDNKDEIYNLFDEFSKKSNKYNADYNKYKFLSLDPIIDINYLFKLANINYLLKPHFDFAKIMFDETKHSNLIKTNEEYIDKDIDTNIFLKYKFNLVKSTTGTGKTTLLQKIISNSKIKNIICITSRKNLAAKLANDLQLQFYDNKDQFIYDECYQLSIQLDSLCKAEYELFKDGIVVLDELNSLLCYLRSQTLEDKRSDIYCYLVEIIKNARFVIGCDADICNWNIDFLLSIHNTDYIVYYNTFKNKKNTKAIIYDNDNKIIQTMIDIVIEAKDNITRFNIDGSIKDKKFFIGCFDCKKTLDRVKNILSKYCNPEDILTYSSDRPYGLIDTTTWINKFVLFTPTILYGIDFPHTKVDVFSFTVSNHLNPLSVYQMISRARDQDTLHIYVREKNLALKYLNVNDVINEV